MLTEEDRLRVDLKETFVPGKRRPWALDRISLASSTDQKVLDLSPEAHYTIIESVYKTHRQSKDSVVLSDSDYAWAGLVTHGRLFFQNNHGGEHPSIGDFHASQLKKLTANGLDINSGHWAIVGTGPDASQIINTSVLLDGIATIDVFEQDPSKIEGAEQTVRKSGLDKMLDEGRIRFFPGNAMQELPRIASEVGGFSGLDLQLLLQHFPRTAFEAFLKMGVGSVKPGGAVMVNELMVNRWGIKIAKEYETDPDVQAAKDIADRFLYGLGEQNGFGVKDYGWRLRTASMWDNKAELKADIQSSARDLEFITELEDELVVDRVVPGTPHHTLTLYICPTIAGGLTNRLSAMRKGTASMEEIARMEGAERWVWEWAERYHRDVLLGQPARDHKIEIVYPPLVGVAAVKK